MMSKLPTAIRELQPAAAWREAERRAIAVGVCGFFVCGVLQVLGLLPFVHKPILAALSGMVGLFLAQLALSVAQHRGSWVKGALAAIILLAAPFGMNMIWVRISNRSLLIPTLVVGLCCYGLLMAINIATSRQHLVDYALDQVHVDEKQFQFRSRWVAVLFWAMVALGFVVLLALIR